MCFLVFLLVSAHLSRYRYNTRIVKKQSSIFLYTFFSTYSENHAFFIYFYKNLLFFNFPRLLK
ncbi:hypothetical protein HMPREF1039_0830 [Megasphaera lornae]|uniref:Uncharacterized protein n=1 Tax=Megasphaera lornae TaxID=1000568 RepID=A0ABN0D2Z5_9FIRM|nr:hypothetical protein HMPREF1039_0830 [Megasphaera lornae]